MSVEEKVLSAEGLHKTYKHRHVVNNVSLEFRTGEVVGLLGPNGAGKTTSFYMILGLVQPDKGVVKLNGKPITDLRVYQRARIGIGYLPQEASVFRDLSVRENIELVLEERGLPARRRHMRADVLMNEFGLMKLQKVKGYALSGGERRRVEIARTLANDPSFILLDEPFAGIDPIAIYDIQQVILKLRTMGYGILITDHNVRDTLAITDRAYLLYEGQIMVQGTAQEFVRDEFARKHYLTDSVVD